MAMKSSPKPRSRPSSSAPATSMPPRARPSSSAPAMTAAPKGRPAAPATSKPPKGRPVAKPRGAESGSAMRKAARKMATGGTVRGAGAATRGTGYSKSC